MTVRDVVDEFFVRFNARDVDALFSLIAPECTYGEPLVGVVMGRDEWESGVRATLELLPERSIETYERLNGVDGVAVRAKWVGGPAGSGKDTWYEVLYVFETRDDQITRVRGYQ